MQLSGKLDSSLSLMVRPVYGSGHVNVQKLYSFIDSIHQPVYSKTLHFSKKSFAFDVLPVTIVQQFNTHHPYGWNDGAMIAAKGYQSLISAGIHVAAGPLEIQLRPEFLYAANPAYESTVDYGSNNNKSYNKILPGQSSISLSAGAFSAGVSTENLWWGPGQRSSLLMSNNATAFSHVFFRTRKPVRTGIGSFEWQLISGRLESDNSLPYENFNLKGANLSNDWRYLNGLVITYQPKWVPGLFLGFTRALQRYNADIVADNDNFFGKYLPVLVLAVEKKNAVSDDSRRTDQLASFFLRWLFIKAKAEVYFEYGFNDYGVNFRDYIMAPSHAAAYLAGFKKILSLPKPSTRLELGFELTQMSQSPDYLVRDAGNWYVHSQVSQGYTNNNQIMGAGAGLGANVQSLTTTWISGWKQLGILFERVERDPQYHANHWIDFGIGILPQVKYGNMILSGKFQFINSSQYAWEKDVNRFNMHSRLSIQYLF